MDNTKEKYLTSKEAMKKIKVSSCDLMHLRTSGKLKYKKKGNAFLYAIESVESVMSDKK